MKKFVRYFSIVLASIFFMVFLSHNSVDAIYDGNKNVIGVFVDKEQVTVTIKYQRGFDAVETAKYYWCRVEKESLPPETLAACTSSKEPAKYTVVNYVEASNKSELDFIAKGSANNVDDEITTHVFTVTKKESDSLEGDYILNNLNALTNGSQESTKYVLFVQASFCAVRNFDAEGNVSGCQYYDDAKFVKVDIDLMDLKNGDRLDKVSTGDEDLDNMFQKISDIVYAVVIPIIWIVLGLFLVVKGSILGVQIVKSADEPQVRQEKIGSLKWLIIGVAISAAAAGFVKVIIGFFSGVFK